MSIVEYKCNKCANEFEKLVFAGDAKDISCPECKSRKVSKKMSVASFLGSSSIGKCATGSPGAGFS
ncbi:MAG: zinc ribbon domain-containing protein [Desulfobacula sp.]|nr:zinc ribbon domain-containing protein [Desulfobacula sp.]